LAGYPCSALCPSTASLIPDKPPSPLANATRNSGGCVAAAGLASVRSTHVSPISTVASSHTKSGFGVMREAQAVARKTARAVAAPLPNEDVQFSFRADKRVYLLLHPRATVQ